MNLANVSRGTETETASSVMSCFFPQRRHVFPPETSRFPKFRIARLRAAQVAARGKVRASERASAGLLLTQNIMLKDAKSLAAAVNKGVFLPGFITAGDPFYMKWSNFIHRTHQTRNYSWVLFFFVFCFPNVFIQTIIDFYQPRLWQSLRM